jgi:hypothetical protein
MLESQQKIEDVSEQIKRYDLAEKAIEDDILAAKNANELRFLSDLLFQIRISKHMLVRG